MNFFDPCECHLLPYYRTLDTNKNNNNVNLTVKAVLYLNDYGTGGKLAANQMILTARHASFYLIPLSKFWLFNYVSGIFYNTNVPAVPYLPLKLSEYLKTREF